jgi:hypothetical protein
LEDHGTKSKLIEIENQEKINQILTAFNHDYELLAKHIKIVRDAIKIQRPLSINETLASIKEEYSLID